MDNENGKGLDAKAMVAAVALLLTLGAGSFYHLDNQLSKKADSIMTGDRWTGSQMNEYKALEDERHKTADQRLERLEDLVIGDCK